MTGNQQSRRGPQPGPDAEVSLEITLEEAAFGASREVTVTLPQRCGTCEGTGCAPGTTPITCEECNGSGELRRVRNSILGQMVTSQVCPRCQGMGSRIQTPCVDCRGDGRRSQSVTLSAHIPAGVEDGSTMRLADRGPAGLRGGANGRLFVHLRVQDDARFQRHGDDLHHEAHITFAQAVLGATITVPTLREEHVLEVDAGSQNGTVTRLRHEGVEHLHGRGRGDLFIHLTVDVPSELDEESETLLRTWAEHRQEAVNEPSGGFFHRRKAKK
jgi:molecular chaperone DnaJ